LKSQYDHHHEDKQPGSKIFTPTSKNVAYQFPEDGNYEDFPQATLQKNQSNLMQHDYPNDKRNMNFNLANF